MEVNMNKFGIKRFTIKSDTNLSAEVRVENAVIYKKTTEAVGEKKGEGIVYRLTKT